MKKIFLFGQHSNRTPFSYDAYKFYFTDYFEYVTIAEDADYLVTGFVQSFKENPYELERLTQRNPNLKLVVLSEEPLWDTLWSSDFQNSQATMCIYKDGKEFVFDYHVLNHITSDIYNFEKIPYFITTCDEFFVRYSNLFKRNTTFKKDDVVAMWRNAQLRYSFFAAKRISESSSVSYENGTILGLNRFRSLVAEGLELDGVLREGQGWQVKEERQKLPDWHLDKLAKLDRNSFVVSALENTHLNNYVSEKIFDAFAVAAIPIYYAQSKHKVFEIVPEESFINIVDKSIEEAIKMIEEFEVTDSFMKNYMKAQKQLSELFANQKYYIDERRRVVDETVKAFEKITSYRYGSGVEY